MKIVVCIKQVPDTTDIKWTEHNTIQREGVESVINPFDEYALETAVRLKEKVDAQIHVISMGPPQAKEALAGAISVGCDEAYLISDKKFSGADTIATARTLSGAIKEKFSDFDLIICGQYAVDGDTAQTGPSIAENLGIPQVTYVTQIISVEDGYIIVKKEIEEGIETLRVKLPALICMQKCDYELRKALISGHMKAQDYEINHYNHSDLNLEESLLGVKGSPTYVSKAFRPEQKTKGEIVKAEDKETTAKNILEKISTYTEEFKK